ncbi:beta/gamma crystallin-related protein [Streptomyces sp. C10]|uniref:beta/gamma crystallin-related protein n=1 Tax=Streptomyces sp. C10 TaxID=531941 RepID=UPI00397F4395
MPIGRTAAVVAAAAVLTLVSALPASADGYRAAAPPKAGRAKVTVYTQPMFRGRYTAFTHSMPKLAAGGWDDIGSARNTGKRTAVFYQYANYRGASFSLAPGKSEPHFDSTSGSLRFR